MFKKDKIFNIEEEVLGNDFNEKEDRLEELDFANQAKSIAVETAISGLSFGIGRVLLIYSVKR